MDIPGTSTRLPTGVVAVPWRTGQTAAIGAVSAGALRRFRTRWSDMDAATVRERASALPDEPGVYQFETDDRVLYVGRAVELCDRVRSYADPRGERIRRWSAAPGLSR